MCGENHLRALMSGAVERLIPACAGKTTSSCGKPRIPEAHPRVCGENLVVICRLSFQGGSSPRVRGKLTHDAPGLKVWGLIPACAGKTGLTPPVGYRRPAHPRVCGENVRSVKIRSPFSGSSPRVRGKLFVPAAEGSSPRVRGKPRSCGGRVRRRRLIPACAGKTYLIRPDSRNPWAHPRVCGENLVHGQGRPCR